MKCNVVYGPILHFKKICFLSGKMSVGAMLTRKGLGPQNPTKKLAHRMDLLGQPLSQNRVIFVR